MILSSVCLGVWVYDDALVFVSYRFHLSCWRSRGLMLGRWPYFWRVIYLCFFVWT
jgi:hypothetical protein